MGKTIGQLGELIQRLVENGVINSNTNLTSQDYTDLVFSARDYILYQRKVGNLTLTNSQVVQVPKEYDIKNGKAILEENFNIQGIDGAVLIDLSGYEMEDMIMPLSPSASHLISNSIFTYYLPNQSFIEFKNLPKNAKKIKLFTIAGSSEDDIVSEDIAFLIIQQVMKIGQLSEASKLDSSADGNNNEDAIKNQIRQLINQPEAIA